MNWPSFVRSRPLSRLCNGAVNCCRCSLCLRRRQCVFVCNEWAIPPRPCALHLQAIAQRQRADQARFEPVPRLLPNSATHMLRYLFVRLCLWSHSDKRTDRQTGRPTDRRFADQQRDSIGPLMDTEHMCCLPPLRFGADFSHRIIFHHHTNKSERSPETLLMFVVDYLRLFAPTKQVAFCCQDPDDSLR